MFRHLLDFFLYIYKSIIENKDRSNINLQHLTNQKHRKSYLTLSIRLMPRSHQGLNTFKSCLVKHSLKWFPL